MLCAPLLLQAARLLLSKILPMTSEPFPQGSALNIVANTQLVESNIFRQVFIPPCTEDSGLALGAAAFAEWKKHGRVQPHSAYLNNWNIEDYRINHHPEAIQEIAMQLARGKIIGVCNGFGEAGPRALGNR
ncbi:MAG: carbamoyltransferase N-terminal domain-containing protein, partial [Desulfosalsimonas sp.]